MIGPEERGSWTRIATHLRPFVAKRIDAEADVDDVVQDVLLRLHRSAATLGDEERFGPWVYRVARSAIADQGRARARHPVSSTTTEPDDLRAEEDDDVPPAFETELGRYVAA